MDLGDDDLSFLENAAANYGDVEAVGPAAHPLPFDAAPRGRAERVDALVLNPSTGDVMEVQNIIYERHADGLLGRLRRHLLGWRRSRRKGIVHR